jgi:peptide subunit release factor 1 (eRF1)
MMPTDLRATLDMLSGQPSTDHPYLSVYLDWTPNGNGDRLSLRALEDELDTIAARLQERGGNLDSFNTDRERVMDYVTKQAPADARGIAIFACDAESIWEAIPLQVPVETRIVEDRFPHCFNLARIIDDYETFAIVLADSQESRILVVSLNEAEQAAETSASEDIKRFDAGGWAQMVFQRRTENVIKAHTKDIGARLERMIKRYKVQHVIIAGNDAFKGVILNTLPEQVKELLVDYINLDITANMQAILDTIEPMMRNVELEQEAAELARLEEQVGANNFGVAGVAETAMALTKGQVRTLFMHQNFLATGGECPNCGAIRAGLRDKCPYDGAELQPVDLREAFTARALQQGSEIQIVEASDFLDQHGGVGALLRYRDTPQAKTV